METQKWFSFEHINFYRTLKNMKDVQQVDYIATDEVLKNNNKEFFK